MDPAESVVLQWVRQALLDLLSGKPADPLAEHGQLLDSGLQGLCETTNHLIKQFNEAHDFLSSLSRGILEIDPPPRNLLISPFKWLHSNLRHLTWQTKQVASGDFSQYVDFLGEFSDAFNTMIASLREKREIELALKRSEERVRLAIDGADLGLWDYDLVSDEVVFNERLAGMLGHDPEEIEPRVDFWHELIHPEDKADFMEAWESHLKYGRPMFRVEHRLRARSGDWKWILCIGRIVDADAQGNPSRVAGIFVDITDRKLAEDQIRQQKVFLDTVIESLTYPFYVVNANDYILQKVNSAARALEITENAPCFAVTHRRSSPCKGADHPCPLEEVKKTGRPAMVEHIHCNEGGELRKVEVHCFPIFDDGGSLQSAIEYFVDVTDREQAQKALLQAEKFRAVADLTSGVAHNFNNILQIVVGNASLGLMNLQSGDLAELRENLQQILESGRFGAETVNRLNRYARGTADDQTAAIEVFDLCNLVTQAAEMSKPWWKTEPEKCGIYISLHTRLKGGCTIRGKKNEMFEVLVNLIRNSVEALPEGGDIEIETAVRHNAVVLSVRDTGMGIPTENLNRLFTPFFTTNVETGRGLGLATCRRIVDAHGGTILVDSAEGKGTTFTITLPLVVKEPLPSEVDQSRSPEKALTILAVDDMEAIVKMLETGLGRLGHKVFTALSGQEAVTILKETSIDVVICDLGMPEMNGWQVGRAIEEICRERGTPKPALIMLTGWEDQSHEKERISESGVDALVQKPVEITKLLEVIGQVMGSGLKH